MSVPSYDDLTPGIPDEIDANSASQLALFLQTISGGTVREPPTDHHVGEPAVREPPLQKTTTLYACLRTANSELRTGPQTANCELFTLLAIARDFSPRVMAAGEREVLLDVSGLGRLIGAPPAIAAALARALFEAGLEASVALAATQIAARLLATQAPNCPATHVPHLPVTLLQPLETLPPAMNHRDRARRYETRDAKRLYEILARWGIATLGDLVALPAAELSSRLGRRGVALQRLARGLDPRPFVPDGETPRYIGRLELEWPLDTLEPLSFVFARLLEPLSAALERADRGAAAIRLDLRLTDRATCTRLLQLPAPIRDPRVLRTLLLLDLESHPPFGGASEVMIDIVSIELDPAPARITQFSLLERALPSPETLSTLTARLSALVGESRIGSAVLVDTHRPGGFAMKRFEPEGRGANGAKGAKGAGANGAEGAGANGAVLRRQRVPPAIRVSVEHGRPVYLAAARRGMPQGAVTQAAGPWRTSGGWWALPPVVDLPPEGGSHTNGPWSRDEWDVALTSGAVCRIYQDRTTERWFLEGIYD
jgi:protein ImuB